VHRATQLDHPDSGADVDSLNPAVNSAEFPDISTTEPLASFNVGHAAIVNRSRL